MNAGECIELGVSGAETIALAASDPSVEYFSDAACSTAGVQTSTSTVYVRGNTVGTFVLTASADNSAPATRNLTVIAGLASHLVLTAPASITNGGCYAARVAITDMFGNPPANPNGHNITLTAAPPLATFSDTSCTIATTTTTGAFYVRGNAVAPAATLTATSNGLSSSQVTLAVIASASKITLTAPVTVRSGTCVEASITARNTSDAPAIVIADERITLSSAASLFSDASCRTPITQTSIPAYSGGATLYIAGGVAGAYTLGAVGPTVGSAPPASFTVTPGDPRTLRASGPSSANVGTCSAFTVTFEDGATNATSALAATQIGLATTAAGLFYRDSACTVAATSLNVAAGSSSVSAYYKATNPENATLTFTSVGLTSAQLVFASESYLTRVRSSDNRRAVFRQMALDASSNLWAITSDGVVWSTSNLGASWTRHCAVPAGPVNDPIQLITAPDGAAYVTTSSTHYNVTASGQCRAIKNTGPYHAFLAPYLRSVRQLAVDANGKIFFWSWDTTTNKAQLCSSTNRGVVYTCKDGPANATAAAIAVHPTDPSRIVMLVYSGRTFYSSDGGNTFTESTSATKPGFIVPLRWDPAHPGYIIAREYASADYGATWQQANHSATNSYDIDASGGIVRMNNIVGASIPIQRATDARTPSFSIIAMLPEGAYNETSLSLAANSQTVVAEVNGHIYSMTSNGANLTRINPPADARTVYAQVVAVSDAQAYGIDAALNVYATTDGGLSWTLRQAITGMAGVPLWQTSETHPSTVYLTISHNNTFNYMATQDGFTTMKTYVQPSADPGGAIGVSLSDPNVFVSYNARPLSTLDGGSTTTTNRAFSHMFNAVPYGVVNPSTEDTLFWVSADLGQFLYAYNFIADTKADISSRVPVPPAGIEAYPSGAGFALRVVSPRGELSVSTDSGASFGAKSSPTTDTCSSGMMIIDSLSTNHAMVAVACYLSSTTNVSRDGGTTWARRDLGACRASQLSVIPTGILATCFDGNSVLVPF